MTKHKRKTPSDRFIEFVAWIVAIVIVVIVVKRWN